MLFFEGASGKKNRSAIYIPPLDFAESLLHSTATQLRTFSIKFLSSVLLILTGGCIQSPFRYDPDLIWPQRVGNFTFQQCVEEMGFPNGKEKIKNGFVASWVIFREDNSSNLNLTFNSNEILTDWYNNRHY